LAHADQDLLQLAVDTLRLSARDCDAHYDRVRGCESRPDGYA